ncbi:hypothetical protein BGZ47_000553 [Haplosporangium gracile]|nr:hypothetical protein BGZ47_000553 [Haplosporangium gracile]
MQLTTLSNVSLVILLGMLHFLVTQKAEAHSYADCIDWRFKDSRNPSWSDKNGACFGYARRFPLKAKPFGKLDSDNPNRHYQQSHKNPDPNHSLACSNGKEGEEPGADETMGNPISSAYNSKDKRGRKTGVQTVSRPGEELCIRWPAKNHAVPNEKNQPVTIALSKVNPKNDPTQLQFLKNIIVELDYKNCSDRHLNTDIWPCGGCFKLPTNLQAGNFVMQWRWKLNSNEWYTSCADIDVQVSTPVSTVLPISTALPASTTLPVSTAPPVSAAPPVSTAPPVSAAPPVSTAMPSSTAVSTAEV